MDLSPTLLIVLGMVCIFLGYVASVLINTLREETEPVGTLDEAPPGGKRGRYTPVTRLWREKKAGSLVVEINGKSFVAPSALEEGERAELEQAARDLRSWLGMGLMPGAVPAEMALPAARPAAASAHAAASGAVNMAGAASVAEASVGEAAGAEAPGVTSSPLQTSSSDTLTESVIPLPAPAATPLPLKTRSIVMQIDDILQDMLAGTPLAARGIKLMEDPQRGVVVMVGIQRYEGIDSVPDSEVKAAIQSAVREWEATQ